MWLASSRSDSARVRLTTPCLVAFSAGICSVWLWSQLPSAATSLVIAAIVAIAAPWLPQRHRWPLLAALAGFLWGNWHAARALDERLASSLEGEALVAVGTIEGLPHRRPDGWRFRFCPQQVADESRSLTIDGCWRLSWRERRDFRRGSSMRGGDPDLRSGERWQLVVRLRRPRGLVNPGGFDSERWALESGTTAIGYVRDDVRNKRLNLAGGIDAARERIATRIDNALVGRERMAALLRGLVVGDRRGFTDTDWRVFRVTGTSHLFSISGLHVGMLAIIVAALIIWLTHACPEMLRHGPRRFLAIVPAMLVAVGYALLAGFEAPTQRSLAMIVFAGLVYGCRRSVGAWRGLCAALAGMLLFDPPAMLGIGFWLSFMGVAWLILCTHRSRSWWRSILRTQCVITLGLLPLCAGFFGETSWVSAPANLIAIPWVTFAIVPMALSSLPFLETVPSVAEWLLRTAALLLDLLMRLLDAVAAWPSVTIVLPEPSWLAVVTATFAVAIALMPLSLAMRLSAIPLALPLVAAWSMPAPPLAEGIVELQVLDVGQGTAVLVRTRSHALLFDTGASIPDSFDAGESVIVPALRALGVERLDVLIVSHADSDHAGGAGAILDSMPVTRILLGEPLPDIAGEPCREGLRWRLDGVDFEVLHPPPRYPAEGNDASCVLKIDAGAAGVLLTGDAGEVAEMRMLALHGERLRSDVLLLGHHGSRTSSSAAFLAAVDPELAVVTAGYRNRFGHPHPKVIRRLAHRGIPVAETSRTGALRIRIGGTNLEREALRERRRGFWHER
jgi:competence protein ComEC